MTDNLPQEQGSGLNDLSLSGAFSEAASLLRRNQPIKLNRDQRRAAAKKKKLKKSA